VTHESGNALLAWEMVQTRPSALQLFIYTCPAASRLCSCEAGLRHWFIMKNIDELGRIAVFFFWWGLSNDVDKMQISQNLYDP
jgi:hypothetical protein